MGLSTLGLGFFVFFPAVSGLVENFVLDSSTAEAASIGGGAEIFETRSMSLEQVPYTGLRVGSLLVYLFYGLLTLWSLFVTYLLVIKRDTIFGFSLNGSYDRLKYRELSTDSVGDLHLTEAENCLHSGVVRTAPIIPSNLPVASDTEPIIGYEAIKDTDVMTALENRAHKQNVLLSSDAMRFFAANIKEDELMSALDGIIARAKTDYSSEDGWIVINLSRMESLMGNSISPKEVLKKAPEVSMTAGSLAEAIVVGNIVAAYEMIASRPMVALADAAADLDLVYRSRKGEKVTISDMLANKTADLGTNQLVAAIAALTSALDGTYSSETEAVKMAIMKAVKAVSS